MNNYRPRPKYGAYTQHRRKPVYTNSQPNRLLGNIAPQLNNDNSRYAEYEIGEGPLTENKYDPHNEGKDDEEFLDDFTPYIEEENGAKIPILPAPNSENVM